jgi:hypothetical protein
MNPELSSQYSWRPEVASLKCSGKVNSRLYSAY